jgi:hypothetical protein
MLPALFAEDYMDRPHLTDHPVFSLNTFYEIKGDVAIK